MNIGNKLCIYIIILLGFSVSLFSLNDQQKAIDFLYNITKTLNGESSSVWGETAKTSDGTEFPCQKYEVTQFGKDFAQFGPPIAYSTSISFSKADEPFSGIYFTVYIVNSSQNVDKFLKMMSDNWVANSSYKGYQTIELKISDTRNDFLLICGNFVVREERFNTNSLKDELITNIINLELCSDQGTQNVTSKGNDTQVIEDEITPDEDEGVDDQDNEVTPEGESTDDSTETPVIENNQQPIQESQDAESATEETQDIDSTPEVAQTPFEDWMNYWNIKSSGSNTRYIFNNISDKITPSSGGYKMIVLKPRSTDAPAAIEGRFEPKTTNAELLLRAATAVGKNISMIVSVEVNGYPVEQGKEIKSSDGWVNLRYNVGAVNPQNLYIVIKVLPGKLTPSAYSYLFIDTLAVEGKAGINKGFKIVEGSEIIDDEAEEPLIKISGLWTDLDRRKYIIQQQGNSFTFSCSTDYQGFLWKVEGTGTILSIKKISINFTETWDKTGKSRSYSTDGRYDSARSIIHWNIKHDRFPSMWLFVR